MFRDAAPERRAEPQRADDAACRKRAAAGSGRGRRGRARPRGAADCRHDRSRARRDARGAQIPAADDARVPVARGRAPQRRAILRAGRDLARAHVRGRHLRSPRRRVLPLLRRRALAHPAFREDALRQRAASSSCSRSHGSAPATRCSARGRARPSAGSSGR